MAPPRGYAGKSCEVRARCKSRPVPGAVAAKLEPMSRYDDMPPQQLEQLRRMIEDMDTIEVIDDDTRELIAKRWPWLLDKLTPKKPS